MNNPDKKKRRSEHANDVSWLSRSKKPRGELGHVDHVSQRRLQVWWACVKNRSLANLLEKLTIGQRTVREMRATVLRFAPREGQAPHTVGDVVRTFKSSTAVFDAFLVDSAFAPSSPSHHDHELYDVTLKYRLMAALEEIEADRDACAEPLDDWTAMKRVMQTRVAFPAEPPPEELKIPARADSDETSLATDQNVTATQQGVSRLLRELTEDEQAYVREMLSRIGPAHEVLASSGTNYVTRENLQTLQPRVWLNDAIINCFFHLLGVRDAELCRVDEARKRCHFFTSYFMDKLTNKDHANPDLIGTYRFVSVEHGWYHQYERTYLTLLASSRRQMSPRGLERSRDRTFSASTKSSFPSTLASVTGLVLLFSCKKSASSTTILL